MKKTFIWYAMAALMCTGFAMPANADTVVVDPGTRAILDNAVLNVSGSDLCSAPACTTMPVVETTCAPACAAPVIETRRSHFLRFGLGPILDFGLL